MNHGRVILPVAILWSAVATIALADTFTVINTDDTGTGSLRQAMTDANNHSGLDTIAFDIPGTGVHTISPATQLPSITSPVTLDGYTQSGSSANTLANGDDAVLLIEINGAVLGNNADGLVLASGGGGSTIRGLVLDNGWSLGINIQTTNIVVEGCFLGTDPTGLVAHGNTQGIGFSSSFDTSSGRIGGTSPGQRNVISGNSRGVSIDQFVGPSTNQVVQGNFIGTDATGTNALANNTAVLVTSSDNLIGGTDATARNIIAGNGNSQGIEVNNPSGAPTGNRIQGNFIGTDVTGTKPMGFSDGIFLAVGSSATQVGGLTATPGTPPGNVIAASITGITVAQDSNNNVIQGNLIGTDASGMQALANSLNGIDIQGASNLVGGMDVMARNIIAANGLHGISLGTDNAPVHDNLVQGNFIGTDITGLHFLSNGGDGVHVVESFANTIGGTQPGAGNLIAGNGGRGVNISQIFTTTGIAIEGNSIFENGSLGINLDINDNVTPNDPCDTDTGPNNLQNYPVISAVTISGGSATITGSLNSTPSTTFRLEFFSGVSTDPSGFGEGETFLGFTNVTTDASCNASYSVTFPVSADAQAFSATATDPDGNTSEFSGSSPLPTATPTPTPTASPTPTATPSQLLNISTRMRVQTGDNVLIGGFIITGTGPKRVILRGIGPSLSGQGLTGVLPDPTLELHGAVSINNDNWRDTQEAEIQATGIPPSNDLESAIVASLEPGAYTAILAGKENTTGIGLVEVYDLDQPAGSKLANISTRGFVETGDNVMIGGFITGPANTGATRVLIRAIGPSLGSSGIQDSLQDPTLELHDGSGALIAMNDNWRDTQEAEIIATEIPPTDDRESAILQTLAPGNYTAIVRGKDNTTGVALVEAYNLQ
jgi:hypothetical protein